MNPFKRLLTSFALVFILAISLNSGVARAHELKENNGISSVLHIEPDDNPKAGQPTKITISFADKKGVFNLQNCDCKLGLEQNEKSLVTTSLLPALNGATLDAYSTVTFPSAGEYNVFVTGASKDGAFPSFRLEYPQRVASGVSAAATVAVSNHKSGATTAIFSLASFAVLSMIAFVAIGQGGRYKSAPEAAKTKKA